MNQIQSDTVADLFAALSKMQGQLGHAHKDKVNPHFQSKFASLESVIDASKKPLADNGLSVFQTTMNIEGKLTLITTLGHSSGQWIRSYTPILSEKQTAQGMGSGQTYARRYAYVAIVGLADTDDDGNEASAPAPAKVSESRPATVAGKALVIPKNWKPFAGRALNELNGNELSQFIKGMRDWKAKTEVQGQTFSGLALELLEAAEVMIRKSKKDQMSEEAEFGDSAIDYTGNGR